MPVKVPPFVETTSVAVALPPGDRLRLVGVRVMPGPLLRLGVIVADSVKPPLKPLRLLSVMMELADWPLGMLREVGLDLIAKSGGGGAVLVKFASRTFSGTTAGPVTVTQTLSSLLPRHDTGNSMNVPGVVPTML